MAYKDMYTIDKTSTNTAAWFHTKLTLTSGTYSDIYRVPIQPIAHIGAFVTGSGYLEFSLDNLTDLDAGTASFTQWDGAAQINPAVTGWRAYRTAGTVVAGVVIKTLGAS